MSKKICYSMIGVALILFFMIALIFVAIYFKGEILRITLYSEDVNSKTGIYSVIRINGNGRVTAIQFEKFNEQRGNAMAKVIPEKERSVIEEAWIEGRSIRNYATKFLSPYEIAVLLPKLIKLSYIEYQDDIAVMGDVRRAIVSIGDRSCICVDNSYCIDEMPESSKVLIDTISTCVDFSPIEVRRKGNEWNVVK